MKVHLRFGMHRDTQILHEAQECVDGLVMPAHILAYQPASASVFLTSMSDQPYLIDPMTFLFQSPREAQVKASVQELCKAYYPTLLETMESLPEGACINDPSLLPDATDLSAGVLDFQQNVVAKEAKSPKAAKYIARKKFGKAFGGQPRALVAPYFHYQKAGDSWYQFNKECLGASRDIAGKRSLAVVVNCGADVLDEESTPQICSDLDQADTALIWVDNFNEVAALGPQIRSVRQLVASLRGLGVAVEMLYGGYLSMLMQADGMEAVSHGILFSQHKSNTTTPGGGGVPERYYIPGFHAFRSLSQTDLILHKHPELMCNCPVCTEVLAGDPDRFIYFGDNPELLRKHFLHARRKEARDIISKNMGVLIAELNDVYERYHPSVSDLPNPDAVISHSSMSGLGYLRVWVDALAA